VDVAEISKLDSYLKRLFSSPRIRVVPRPQRDDYAEVFLGDELFGRIVVDDEDDERSYNFEKAITLPGSGRSPKLDNETVTKLNKYLKEQLGDKFSVRKRPTKTDSADLHGLRNPEVLVPVSGHIERPTGPGLGVDVDEAYVREHHRPDLLVPEGNPSWQYADGGFAEW